MFDFSKKEPENFFLFQYLIRKMKRSSFDMNRKLVLDTKYFYAIYVFSPKQKIFYSTKKNSKNRKFPKRAKINRTTRSLLILYFLSSGTSLKISSANNLVTTSAPYML